MGLALDQIYPGDCVKLLNKLDPSSVHLAFADPPFNIGYKYDVYDDKRAADEYLAWSREWIEGVRRVLRPDGAFWLAIGDDFAAELKVLCTRDLGFHCRSWVVWFYTFGVHCKYKFTRSHTHLFHFVMNPKAFTFNSLEVRVPSARALVYGDKRADPDGRVPDDTWMRTPVLPPDVPTRDGFVLRPQDIPERFPAGSDTWYFSRVAGTFGERRGWHGCQMPEQLLGRIIRACSNEGDMVIDPFGGSGTTLAVAKKLQRRFVGFELSEEYAAGIEKRLADIKPGDALTGPADALTSAPKTKNGRALIAASRKAEVGRPARPIVAKADSSLAQIAASNREYSTAVAMAFMAAHDGYSVDRLLADPALDDRFLENCRKRGIPGAPKDWNHLLLNMRKRCGLSEIDTSRRTCVPHRQLDPFVFASEIAWRKLSDEHECTLDDILADPKLASLFDRTAKGIAPGHSPFHYRWAALAVRREASKGRKNMDKVNDRLGSHIYGMDDREALPEKRGHYLVTTCKKQFFVGFTDNLRTCHFFALDRVSAATELMGIGSPPEAEIRIRIRLFKSTDVSLKAARRAKLLSHYEPIANAPNSCEAA